VLESLGRYAAAGATDLCIRFAGEDQLEQLERFTGEVWPRLERLPGREQTTPRA
jgi:hypothetical protein